MRTLRATLFLIALLLPYGTTASVVPIPNIVCGVKVPEIEGIDMTLTSFFDKDVNLGGYVPSTLTEIDPLYIEGDTELCLREDSYHAFLAMNAALNEDIGTGIKIRSAFRSYDSQTEMEKKRGAFAAEAGRSEHQLGTAMDLAGSVPKFEDSIEYKWMKENAASYGFVQTYKAEHKIVTNIPEEPWHWRFVGVEVAEEIKEVNIDVNVYLYGFKMKLETGQSLQALPQPFQLARSANSLLLQQVS